MKLTKGKVITFAVILVIVVLVINVGSFFSERNDDDRNDFVELPSVNDDKIKPSGVYSLVSSEGECLKYVYGNDLVGGCYTEGEERPNTLIGVCDRNQDCMVELDEEMFLYGDKWSCEDFRSSNCPIECNRKCVSSICTDGLCTMDCDGVGSCFSKKECMKEGESVCVGCSPEFISQCCEGLELGIILMDGRPLIGGSSPCIDPVKVGSRGMPFCDGWDTHSEGWYYPAWGGGCVVKNGEICYSQSPPELLTYYKCKGKTMDLTIRY